MTTMKLGIAGIALTISTAVLANNNVLTGRVPTTYVSIDGLDHIASGSGVAIGPHDVLTAEHVVDDCTAISVDDRDAYVLAHDEVNDLAVVRTKDQWATWALFSNDDRRVRAIPLSPSAFHWLAFWPIPPMSLSATSVRWRASRAIRATFRSPHPFNRATAAVRCLTPMAALLALSTVFWTTSRLAMATFNSRT